MSGAVIRARLDALRRLMARDGLDAYLLPASDFHASEYVGDYFKVREYFSGFTGSAGTLLVLPDMAGLWTDSRYFLQAERELEDTGISLFRLREPDVPDLDTFLARRMPEGGALGIDGRTLSGAQCDALRRKLEERRAVLRDAPGLIDALWTERPPLPRAPAFLLDERYTGVSAGEKLTQLRRAMAEAGADLHFLTTLDDIAWLFNLRGGDVDYNPVLLAYAAVSPARAFLFTDAEKLADDMQTRLAALGVTLLPYEDVYAFARENGADARVLLSTRRVNEALCAALLESGATLLDRPNPTARAKAVKNETELAHMRLAHLKDGAALTRMLYRLKTRTGGAPMTELSVARELDALRREQGALGPSFETIAGYGPHGAVVHYTAAPETDVPLLPGGLLLLDSGGQYLMGTTDVTRTVALGTIPETQRRHFTLVLRGMLSLAHAVFPRGTRGDQLDILARAPLWAEGLDYGHSTGHGVGCYLSVHEAYGGIRPRPGADGDADAPEPGMILSDEPGLYIAGSHGVRHENLLLCRRAEHPGFLCFETLTLAPFDLDAVDAALLGPVCAAWLDAYHRRVRSALSPLLNAEERAWLREATRPLQR